MICKVQSPQLPHFQQHLTLTTLHSGLSMGALAIIGALIPKHLFN